MGTFQLAEEAAFNFSTDVIDKVKGALAQYFTLGNLMTLLVAVVGITAVFALGWFAYRFIKGKVAGALTKGKL